METKRRNVLMGWSLISAGVIGRPTSATAQHNPQHLSTMYSGSYNIKSWGARLDGTMTDAPFIQAAYNDMPDGAIMTIPIGNWCCDPVAHFKSIYDTKHILWVALGTLDQGTASAGTKPVLSIGDGDVFESFYAGAKLFSKTYKKSCDIGDSAAFLHETGGAAHAVNVINDNPAFSNGYSVIWGDSSMMTSTAQSKGYSWAKVHTLNSFGRNDLGGQDVASVSRVQNYGKNSTWATATANSNLTGLQPVTFGDTGHEGDMFTNGPDPGGGRVHRLLTNNQKDWPAWSASQKVVAAENMAPATIIEMTPPGCEACTYICIQSGITGAVTPNFTQPTYPDSATFADGTAIWQYGTTVRSSMDKGDCMQSSGTNSYNTMYWMSGAVNNAIIDATLVTFKGNAMAMSLPENAYINFTALSLPSPWKANRAYSAGQRVIPNDFKGYIYVCTTAGVSGSTQPAFQSNGTVTDNNVVWSVHSFGRRFGYTSYGRELIYQVNASGSGSSVIAWSVKDDGAMATPFLNASSTEFTITFSAKEVALTVTAQAAISTVPLIDSNVYVSNESNPSAITIPSGTTWFIVSPASGKVSTLSLTFPNYIADGQELEITFDAAVIHLSFVFPSGSTGYGKFPANAAAGTTMKFRAANGKVWRHILYN
jgi:hypothetical protein